MASEVQPFAAAGRIRPEQRGPWAPRRESLVMPLPTFVRPNYFFGKQLSVEDLQREQAYHRDKGRLRNRLLFGPGVVGGLRVSVEQHELVVSPGLAFDCQGNELVVATEHRQPLPSGADRRFVTLRYAEIAVGSVPAPNGAVEPASIEEIGAVEVLAQRPANCDVCLGARLRACDQAHAVCIATLRRQGTRWRVSSSRVQRHRGG